MMYVGKMILLFIARPRALCLLARAGEPWETVTALDLNSVLASRGSYSWWCSWERRYNNACELVSRKRENLSVIATAVESMARLMAEKDDEHTSETQRHLVSYLRQMQSDAKEKPALMEKLNQALLTLCPGLKDKDLKAPAPVAGNLGYVATGEALSKLDTLVQSMHDGKYDVKALLQEHDQDRRHHAEKTTTIDEDLMVCVSDLEPDDTMAIAQLWQLKVETRKMRREPIVIYAADFTDKEKGTVFEKKLLMTQLMLGTENLYVVTPDPALGKDGNTKQALHWSGQRESALRQVCEEIANFPGKNIHFYIMAPGRGNLGGMKKVLTQMGKWPLKQDFTVSLYSGSFNMRGMQLDDLPVLKEIAAQAAKGGHPMMDAAKFPFFGKDNSHPWAESFTTFATEHFARELNLSANPLLVAALKALNDEHNMGLIAPEKLYKDRELEPFEKKRFDVIQQNYPNDLPTYCNDIIEDFVLYCKTPNFKKSTIAAFAFKNCDSPLCDQLIFIMEYMLSHHPKHLTRTQPGKWNVDEKKGFTSVDNGVALSERDTQASQPVLSDPHNEECLKAARIALQDYLMRHLRSVY
jgi:hypothetical protein